MPENKPITKVLVANRGEIARRVFESCRRMGIATVAVHSDPDADAPFVAEADEAVSLGGMTGAESYMKVDAVLAAAEATGADAIHPGYGFLSENAGFAEQVAAAGLTWIGPPSAAIEAMGSKVRARSMMDEAGVPILPGVELDESSDVAAEGERVGYPLLVKASAGGGGKGMRTVSDPSALADAVDGARREAAGAFGDDTVFLERFLERPRHVEIQVFADSHGNTVSLGERECSIQRRHQKVVEESPSPAVDPELRARMGEAAVAAAEAVGYRGAGTVEFLLGPDGDFFFLEMNTRLQVEHPVTEMVTGLDLVRLQLLVAAGEPLPAEALQAEPRGHAIEVRLYAEDAANDYLPQIGVLGAFEFGEAEEFAAPGAPATGVPLATLRLDAGFEAGQEVSPHYDPMLAKLIAFAPTRWEAARLLAAALRASRVHGVVTNRDFLVRVLEHEEFISGATDTGFLERHSGLGASLADTAADRIHAVAAALAAAGANHRALREALQGVRPGWRNNPSQGQLLSFAGPEEEIEVELLMRRSLIEAVVGGESLGDAVVHGDLEVIDGSRLIDLELGGVRRDYLVARRGDGETFVNSPLGQSALSELPRFPAEEEAAAEGALVAPMPGKVIKLAAAEGSQVEAGSVIFVLEAMKMEHELTAPASGILAELRVGEGDQVESGALLGLIEPAE